ncbi:uncharacterized protein LOC144910441 [Branchiostoma floridae x Branchiostoma belcheri]
MAADRTVLVSSIPADLTGDKIEIHFGKKSTGGGDIEKVDFQAKVTFYSAEVATRVVNRSHRLGKQSVPVKVEPLAGAEGGSQDRRKGGRIAKQVFASVAAVVTAAEVPDLAECPEEIMAALSAQTGVTWVPEPGGYRLQGTWGQVENARCLLQRRYCRDDETNEAVESGQQGDRNDVEEPDNKTDPARASPGDAALTAVKMAWGSGRQNFTTSSDTTRNLTPHVARQTSTSLADRDHAAGIRSADPNSTTRKQNVLPVDDAEPEANLEASTKVATAGTQQSTRSDVVLEVPLTSDESSDSDLSDEWETKGSPSHLTTARRGSFPDTSAEASAAVKENEAPPSGLIKTTPHAGMPKGKARPRTPGESAEESDDVRRHVTTSAAKHVTVDPDIMAYIVHKHKDKLAAIEDKFKVMIKMENSTDCIVIQPKEQCSRHELEEAYETFVSLYQEMFKDVRPHRANLAEVHIPIESIRFVLDMITREHDKVFIKLNDGEKTVLFCGEEDMVRKARAKLYEVLSIPDPDIAHRRNRRRATTTNASTPAANNATTNKDANRGPQAQLVPVAGSKAPSVDNNNSASFESHTGVEADSTGSVPEKMGTRNRDVRPKSVRSKLPTQGSSPVDSGQPFQEEACRGDLSTDSGPPGGANGVREGLPAGVKTCHVSRDRLDFVTRTGVKVLIYQGDVTQEVADVIVSCNTESLDSGSGIARAISEAGGPEIRRACTDYIRRHGRLSAGQSIWTPGGRMRCQYVVHTVSPQPSRDQTDHHQLFSAFLDLLNIAEFDLKVNSIAIPAIGSGFPTAVCADVMCRVISAFEDYQTPDSLLKEIRLVNINAKTTATFVEVFSQHFTDIGVSTASVGQGPGSGGVPGARPGSAGVSGAGSGSAGVPGARPSSAGVPGARPSSAGVPGARPSSAGVPGARPSSAGVPGARPGSAGVPGARPSSAGVPGARPSFVGVPGARPSFAGVPGARPGSAGVSGAGPGSPSVSGAGNKDARLYVFTGGKGKGERGGKMRPAAQPGTHARGLGYGKSKPSYSRVGNVACNFNTRTGGGYAQKLGASLAEDDDSDEVDEDDKCPICLGRVSDPRTLDCRHTFCNPCIDMSLKSKPECPVCKMPTDNRRGNQPDGTMSHRVDQGVRLPGYERYGTIVIDYHIPGGIQGKDHPNPGQRFSGDMRTAYLPDSPEGREVLRLLRRAFDCRLVFTVGTSVTTGQPNTLVWNDIQHKTNTHGGPINYGYPDPTYLQRVRVDLASKGIK